MDNNMNKFYVLFVISMLMFAQSSFAWFTPQGADLTKSGITFEGNTDDAYETSVTVEEPTADRTIKIFNRDSMVPIVATVATLPTPSSANKGLIAAVTDAVSATDCTIGGASNTVNLCFSGGGGAVGNWINLN